MKKRKVELAISKGFEGYGNSLNSLPSEELNREEAIILKEAIVESKISCMTGMLLCLEREQRLIYVLGDIFGMGSRIGAQLFGITEDNLWLKADKLDEMRSDIHAALFRTLPMHERDGNESYLQLVRNENFKNILRLD